ncbi:hypothetical protein IFM89_021499 [Coptis chinensis]|uniref:Uncharacterized protein n=1 Tax=Coptis chinensis TaxID=261450 RepID=A0A835H4I3_9MAGN|nr:hypothetical protein IFM89_021499 [Coptis chinensis]
MVYWFFASFVSASLQVLLEKLADLGISVYKSIGEFDDKLKKLERTLKRVQFLIHEAEEKQLLSDMEWKGLLQDLEQVAYDADDLVDEIAIKILKLEGGKLKKNQDQVTKLLSSLFKCSSAPNLSNIQAKLEGLLGELGELSQRRTRHDTVKYKLQTTSFVDESRVFGREADKSNVEQILLASSPSEESSRKGNDVVSVVPIVGMAGVGKTTLAQLLYNHDYVYHQRTKKIFNLFPFSPKQQAHFNLKMWISVTEDFDVMKLTRSMIEAAANGESAEALLSLDSLQVKLKSLLQNKKFLLVLDDLRIEKQNDWELLLQPLRHGLKGSKIIVTTRSLEVSKLVSAGKPYHLQCLLDGDCWSLLKEEALGNTDLNTVPELNEIGIKIAMKCKGLPLAAKTLGALLHSVGVDENEWNKILQSKIWDFIVPDLRSGYHPLPSHLRQCFAYCSLFPQNYDFERDKIVQMWMGEGFIIPEGERKMIQDAGSDYFDHLWRNSFFQVIGGKYYMHDAVREFAQTVSGKKFLRMEKINDPGIDEATRHLSLVCEFTRTTTFKVSYGCKGLRTFLLLAKYKSPIREVPNDLFLKLERLRLLDLSGTHIEELAGDIGNLKHLRFLDLSYTFIKWLPENVKELCILQTLRLRNCLKLLCLPKSIGRLKSLQHLELGGNSKLTSMPFGIGKLTGLQTVREFIVGPERGQLMELKDMNSIRGSLCIKQLEKVNNIEEAVEAKLADKEYLDILELQWTSTADGNSEHVLKELKPCGSLKELTLRRYGGRMFPTWVSDPSFSKLTSISLYDCEKCGLLPPLGKLPKLKFLKIVGMLELTVIGETFIGCDVGFQSLETLEICEMPKLERWVGLCNKDMESLCKLIIIECPQMVMLPSLHYLRSLKKLEIESCTKLPFMPDEGLSSSIETLIITECPLLEDRCRRDGGQDWEKIKHIPYREIGDI